MVREDLVIKKEREDKSNELSQVLLKLEAIEDTQKKIIRRQEEQQKGIDLLFADREIFEDMQGSIQHLKEIIVQNQQHQDIHHDSVKSDIKNVQAVIEDVGETIEKKDLLGTIPKEKAPLFRKFLKSFSKKQK